MPANVQKNIKIAEDQVEKSQFLSVFTWTIRYNSSIRIKNLKIVGLKMAKIQGGRIDKSQIAI
jgi:hypothetical protein